MIPLPGTGVFLSQPGGGPASASPYLTGLSWYYNLDESSGPAADSLNVNPLTAVNSPVGVPGKINNARRFVRSSHQYMTAPNNAALQMGSAGVTIAGWMYLNSLPSANMGIIGKFDTNLEYLITITALNQVKIEACTGAGLAGLTNCISPAVLAINTWYFVGCRYDGTHLYISVNAGAETSVAFAGPIFSSNSAFTLGTFNSSNNSFDGLLDEWGGFKRDLGTTGIAALYNGGAGVTYPFMGLN